MTKEEKQKAIDALKISVPIKALTQEEFNSYIQTLNQIMDWLEQEPFTNKTCVSSRVCEHDKQNVLDKIRAEIIEEMLPHSGTGEETIQAYADGLKKGLDILDKYKAESEVQDV